MIVKPFQKLQSQGWRTVKELSQTTGLTVSWIYAHPRSLGGIKLNFRWLFPPAPAVKTDCEYIIVDSYNELPAKSNQGTIAVTKSNYWIKYDTKLGWVHHEPTDEDVRRVAKLIGRK